MNDQPVLLGRTGSESQSLVIPTGRDRDVLDLQASGLVDADWYGRAYNDPPGIDAVVHFLDHGAREGRLPNPYFATEWYLRQNPDVGMTGQNALLHYIRRGEAECRAPAPHFDLAWYRTRHIAPPGQTLLGHFLERRLHGAASPLPEFDAVFYLETYPDVAAAGVDPFEHFLHWGYREGRNPSAGFDTRYYIRRYLDGDLSENPLLHFRRIRRLLRVHPVPPQSETGVFDAVRRNTRPGPDFEEVEPLPPGAIRRARVLAFYLPQFHAVAENDAWWGRGFTEWTSAARAMPRFEGHYQPRVPRDLGHYTLDGTATLRRQVEMARGAGLAGFVHYFYWFNGRRLLDQPIEAMLADREVDFPFCLMWANENWTRRWDGGDQDILIAQDYRAEDDAALVDCFARHFRDPRYIRLGGRPLLMLYRPALIPDTRTTVARWRALFRARHGEDPVLVMAQSFDVTDPRPLGFDAAVEFPPHKLVTGLPMRNGELTYFDPRATAQVFAYDDVAAASLSEAPPDFSLIKTAVPSWDNDARRQGTGLVLNGASPTKYQAWLSALVARAPASRIAGEAIVCVNAWNEWAEAAYLEPDVHFGGAYLNATARAITGMADAGAALGLLLVGHDAFPAGAQMLLLHLARQLRQAHGLRLEILLLGGGALRAAYEAVAPTTVLEDAAAWPAHLAGCAARGLGGALVNSAVAGAIVPLLAEHGIASTLLVHELPRLLAEKAALGAARAGAAAARQIVFAAPVVQAAFATVVPFDPAIARVMPQGNYRGVIFDPGARARVRAELALAAGQPLVLGAGYGDLRKGFDLFLQTWRSLSRLRPDAVCAWIGAIDPAVLAYLEPEIAAAEAGGGFIRPGFREDAADWFSAADVFCLPSREDPFPTVALEAMAAGLKLVAFEGAGGIAPLLADAGGVVVPMGDPPAMAAALAGLLQNAPDPPARAAASVRAQAAFDFPRYAAGLLATALPDLPRISVVVPNYNHARHLATRLASVFGQTLPVAEVVLLDDASTDDSLVVARCEATAWGRDLPEIVNRRNSANVFAQWRRGAERAVGDWVWIAEADDAADPALLATMAARLAGAEDIVAVACDSRALDAAGAVLWDSHQAYFAAAGVTALAQDGMFAARDFAERFLAERNLLVNASAILFRRTALLAALARCAPALAQYRMAGDWHLYLDLLARSTGQVAWIAAPLNSHRRHDAGVTARLNPSRHLDEIARAQAHARTLLGDAVDAARQDSYRDEVAAASRRRVVAKLEEKIARKARAGLRPAPAKGQAPGP